MNTSKKVLLVGNAQRGKTEWATRVVGTPRTGYVPTQGLEVHPFVSADQKTVIKLWDTAGEPKFACLGDAYYIKADAAIIFADTPEEIFYWGTQVLQVVDVKLVALVPDECLKSFHEGDLFLPPACRILPKNGTNARELLLSL